jgi:hypothetical protein
VAASSARAAGAGCWLLGLRVRGNAPASSSRTPFRNARGETARSTPCGGRKRVNTSRKLPVPYFVRHPSSSRSLADVTCAVHSASLPLRVHGAAPGGPAAGQHGAAGGPRPRHGYAFTSARHAALPASHSTLLRWRAVRLTRACHVRRGAACRDGARPLVGHQPPGSRVTRHALARRLAGPALGPGPLVRAWRQCVPTHRGMHRLGRAYGTHRAAADTPCSACCALQRRLGYYCGDFLRDRTEA